MSKQEKWYKKIPDSVIRWIAIVLVAFLTQSANSDGSPTSYLTPTPVISTEMADSLRECMKETKARVQALEQAIREQRIVDSISRESLKQQIAFTRDDVSAIKQILMSRAFASR